jgi:hypothetical protein
MSAAASVEETVPSGTGSPGGGRLSTPFHIAAVAFLRARQLHAGARARVDWMGHKAPKLAVLEVMAQTVGWRFE